MQYRPLGKLGVSVSSLGFGGMRLPTQTGSTEVDESLAVEMVRYAIDHGVNYVDTAYPYHEGKGEGVIGLALANGYRQRVYLATKLPIWLVHRQEDCDRFLDEQLTRLQTGCIDFYLIHCLQASSWRKMQDLRVLPWCERARASGRINYLGFSFHDSYDAFREIVDGYDWDVCQIQYNYLCEEVQAGTQGLKYAAGKGLGVIIMEPLFGGTLANPPEPVQKVWDTAGGGRSPVELALKWVWNKPEVSTVLSGMSTLEQVKQNVAAASESATGSLSERESEVIAQVREAYRQLSPIPCTKCGYCLPCPNGVNIPLNFELSNQAAVLKGNSVLLCRNLYLGLSDAERATACVECGTCEERCPQQLPIPEMLLRVREQFQ